jgi:glycosyltransferase involved in cell wall biosynthesis
LTHKKLPHICFLAPNAFPLLANAKDIQIVGGAELQQVIIARGLVQRGYRVSMICLDFGQEDKLEIDGIIVHRAFRPSEGLPVLRFIWPRWTSIWRCLKNVNADIYYQRSGGMLTGLMAAFCRRNGKRSIFAVAGNPRIRFRRDRWIYEYGIKNVDRIVVQNAAQERLVKNEFGRNSILVPNCYQAFPHGARSSRKQVLWVSTVREVKRPDIFLDVAQALPAYQFVMVGGEANDGASLYEKIRERAQKLSNVDFVGFVPYAEIDQYFEDAALFVNTSESEGFPNTFLQSWVRGVPTISFVDCGARLNRRPIGQVVNSTDAMISSVTFLLENESARTRLGQDCKTYAQNNHALDRILDLYEDIFQRLLQKNRSDQA